MPVKKATTPSNGSQAAAHKKVVKKQNDILDDIQFSSRDVWRFELIGNAPVVRLLANSNIKAYNPKTGRHENVRYCATEDTIWVSDQPKQVEKTSITLENGFLEVHPTEDTLLEFLFRHPEYNKTFRLVDRERDATKAIERQELEFEALTKAMRGEFSELQIVARALGLDYETENLCRKACVKYAQERPDTFLESFDSEIIRINSLIREAIDFGVINVEGDNVKWSDTGKVAQVCPTGVEPIGYFASILVNPTEKNLSVTAEIRKRIKS